ncbi:hypothetical protein [Streptomyces iconiensis]|uniref:Uncharacterized protein n=1 Tax=Streptomyces iconiensis TaxID=1384038 RepID=A0ABT7A2D8_9ACTN|nr:hypothetical protein [Streptomyces iconiensis]MDJ1135011.1 hypothetical protein [Streptomyces iconiensis]
MTDTQPAQHQVPDRRALADGLGIPVRRVTDAVLAEVARDPMFLHHLELCRDDPGMLDLLLSGAHASAAGSLDAAPAPAVTAAPTAPTAPTAPAASRGNAELLARAGAALAHWAASGFSRTPQAAYEKRLVTCRGCPHLTAPPRKALYRLMGTPDGLTLCGLCGCDVRRKAALASESCPAGRWEEAAP